MVLKWNKLITMDHIHSVRLVCLVHVNNTCMILGTIHNNVPPEGDGGKKNNNNLGQFSRLNWGDKGRKGS